MATVTQTGPAQRFLIRDADWQTYQSMLTAVGDRPVRITYDRGILELMSPSDRHERFKKLIDRMLTVLSDEAGLPIRSQGSTTLGSELLDRGLEPDECYYIHNERIVRGREELDLAVDPPPDLAVEIDVTRSSLDRMEIYTALGIPEVWRFDGERLHVDLLGDDGRYAEASHSRAFPFLPVSELSAHLARRNEADEMSWQRAFRSRVRELLEGEGEDDSPAE